MDENLEELRKRIDKLDEQIVKLINARADLAAEIGRLKRSENAPVYVPHREAAVFEKISAHNPGPLPDSAVRAIYREIMGATIALQRPMRVSFFGEPGSFTHMAAYSKFGAGIDFISKTDIAGVFRAVANDNADYGVIPVENSTEGTVTASCDILAETHLKASSEIYLPIHHNLLSISARDEIDIIFSHPQPFAQCRGWLAANYPNAELRTARSTSAAARLSLKTPRSAAIASRFAAEIHNIPVLHANIEDVQNNVTRFFVIGKHLAEKTGNDKTSLVFSVKHEPGALLRILRLFNDNKVNMTKIESRPSKRKSWEYIFFVDCVAHYTDESMKKALEEISKNCHYHEIIGSYPIAEISPLPATNPILESRKEDPA